MYVISSYRLAQRSDESNALQLVTLLSLSSLDKVEITFSSKWLTLPEQIAPELVSNITISDNIRAKILILQVIMGKENVLNIFGFYARECNFVVFWCMQTTHR